MQTAQLDTSILVFLTAHFTCWVSQLSASFLKQLVMTGSVSKPLMKALLQCSYGVIREGSTKL